MIAKCCSIMYGKAPSKDLSLEKTMMSFVQFLLQNFLFETEH